MSFTPVILWSDALVFLLLAAGIATAWYIRRREHLLLPWRRVAQNATAAARQRLQDEVGDILFALVNLARVVKVNPEEALRGSANRFAARFTYMEQAVKARGRSLSEMTLAEMDRLWDEAKAAERSRTQP